MLFLAVIVVLCLLFLLTWSGLAPPFRLNGPLAICQSNCVRLMSRSPFSWQFVCLDCYLWLSIPAKLTQLPCFVLFSLSQSVCLVSRQSRLILSMLGFFFSSLGTLISRVFFLFSLWCTVVTLPSITSLRFKETVHKLPSTAWNTVLHASSTSKAFKPASSIFSA